MGILGQSQCGFSKGLMGILSQWQCGFGKDSSSHSLYLNYFLTCKTLFFSDKFKVFLHITWMQKEDIEPLAGYLSLHQNPEGLTIKWTPNQLMNGCCEDESSAIDRRSVSASVWCSFRLMFFPFDVFDFCRFLNILLFYFRFSVVVLRCCFYRFTVLMYYFAACNITEAAKGLFLLSSNKPSEILLIIVNKKSIFSI